MKKLFGVVCATITPMISNGEIDEASLKRLCNYLMDNGINGIYPNGTNGEGIMLSEAERQRVSEIMVEENNDRISAYIQCGSVTTEETISHVLHSKKIGAHGVGIMTPLFFHQDDLSLEQYYEEILDAVGESFPAYVYNIPSHTNNDIQPELFSRLMKKHINIQGIKFSAPDLMRAQDYLIKAPGNVDLLIGCDSLFLQCLMTGGVGTISGPAMVFAKRFVKLYQQYLTGDYEGAAETQRKIVDTDRKLAGIPSIPAIKTMLKILGVIDKDICRKPFRALNNEEIARLKAIIKEYETEL